jgi:hypothetical protein
MFARFGAQLTVVDSAAGRHLRFHFRILAAIAATAASLAGCMPETTRLAGTDPADPSAHAARVGYSSTIAPYTAMRPSKPTPSRESWRERNDSVAPLSRPDR